jgi:hypothetical protein
MARLNYYAAFIADDAGAGEFSVIHRDAAAVVVFGWGLFDPSVASIWCV